MIDLLDNILLAVVVLVVVVVVLYSYHNTENTTSPESSEINLEIIPDYLPQIKFLPVNFYIFFCVLIIKNW